MNNKIEVTHLGEDYATVAVNGKEFETSKGLGIAIMSISASLDESYIYPSIKALVDYLYEDEENHWLEMDKPHAHIFQDVRAVGKWLKTKKIIGDALSK